MAASRSNPTKRSPAEAYAAHARRSAHPELAEFIGELDFELDPFQRTACQALESGRGVLVCAPTGAGKTVVGEFAVLLPVRVIAELLPLPADARDTFASWADSLLRHTPGAEPRARDTMDDMRRIIGSALSSDPPADSLLAGLLTARGAGRLDADELTSMVFYLLFVWYEIMVHAVSSAMLRLLGSERLDTGVEEVLRLHPPQLLAAPRYPLHDLEIGGVSVRAGDTLLLSLASATRDERVFSEPSEFVPDRNPNPHLSLGHGIHACPASTLTRVIACCAVEALHAQHPHAAPIPAPVTWRGNFRHHGPAALRANLTRHKR